MSDKTTAALATEQADAEATTMQETELLPAATLDELEQVDLGTVAEGERAPFRITDDRCADWAIRKIADERSEYDRLKALADEQIAAINEKVAAARKRMENGTSYLTSCLADFFATVPHKETKTTEKYRLLSGTLTFKKGTTKTKLDETIEATVHAVGWNDDPAKAKGAAHTYALKYYLFEKFTVDQGEDDPDNSDFGAQGKGSGAGGSQQATQGRQGQGSGRLSDAQLARLYKKAEAAGMTKERTNARIVEKYKKQDPATLTRQEYDEICTSLDNAAAQHNQQGGNA